MPRRPIDKLTQQELILRVRLLLDQLCPEDPWRCNRSRCWNILGELLALIGENPHSIWSHKVTYNIGRARARRLAAILRGADGPTPTPIRHEPLVGDSLP